MKTPMLEYAKIILNKVSFDHNLLKKEYFKALGWLSNEDAVKLKQWVKTQNIHI